MSFKSISQGVTLTEEQTVKVIADLEDYDNLKQRVPMHLERISILESIVAADSIIIQSQDSIMNSFARSMALCNEADSVHEDQKEVLRADIKKYRRQRNIAVLTAVGYIIVKIFL